MGQNPLRLPLKGGGCAEASSDESLREKPPL